MHADGYAGFEDIYRSCDIHEVACMAHVRRKFVDVHRAQEAAIADEAIRRIAQFYAVEKAARGSPPDRRVEIRQAKAAPNVDELESWLHDQLPTISSKSPLAMAIRYGLTRLRPNLDHGFLELDNNAAERAIRSVAVGRKNYLFVSSQTGGRAAAIVYTLIETAKLNGVEPQAWLADTLARRHGDKRLKNTGTCSPQFPAQYDLVEDPSTPALDKEDHGQTCRKSRQPQQLENRPGRGADHREADQPQSSGNLRHGSQCSDRR